MRRYSSPPGPVLGFSPAERRTMGGERREWRAVEVIAVRAFCNGGPKPDNGARLSRNPRENFFLNVNYLTLLDRFLNDTA
jgi:hypothetical protein